ncbi:MAG TPA: S16 family serine protease [Amnibacterium sp.]|nr:S16 family serine protease [Amnibacterium sp.]
MRVRGTAIPWPAVLPVVALVLVLVTALLPAPYVIESPGPVTNTLGTTEVGGGAAPVIEIPGRRTYPTSGALDLLTVRVVGSPTVTPSWLTLATTWFDPAQSVTPIDELYPPGLTQQQSAQAGAAEMTGSQRSAVAAALTALGYPVVGTVTVRSVGAASPAAGAVRPGDVVRSFAGHAPVDSCTLQDLVLAHGTAPTTIVLQRSGHTRTAIVAPRPTDIGGGRKRPLLGITTSSTYRFPFSVRLRLADVDGPSAGMMFALGIIDRLTPGPLTGGAHVAGTGTICGDGTVGAIGGIIQKMAGARRAGATVFLAPASNCDEVVGHVPAGLRVFAVHRLSDALTALRTVAAHRSSAGLPTCSTQVGSSG